jgi:hypothetical protein
MKFEWDPAKSRQNEARHDVTFSEATTVFGDPLALSWPDLDHSEGEYRILTIGYTELRRLVIVAHAERDDRIRIISARLVTATERRLYESGQT